MVKSLLAAGLLAMSIAVGGGASIAKAEAINMPHDRSLVLSTIDTTGHDGPLTLKEVYKAATEKFVLLDTDRDNKLDARELTGILTRSELSLADTDKDGALDKAEYLALTKAKFAAADGDHDGTLNSLDLSTQKGIDLVALLAY